VGAIIVALAAATLIEVITQRRAAQRRSLWALYWPSSLNGGSDWMRPRS